MNPHMNYYDVGITASITKTISEYDTYAYCGITGDFYDIHINEEFAKGTMFGKRIAQGSMLVGFMGTLMGQMAKRAPHPGAVSYKYEIKFTAPVYFGDTVTTEARLSERRDERNECVFEVTCSNQASTVVATGSAVLKVLDPNKAKKA